MTSTRRPADVPVHEWHHRLIAERFAAYDTQPKRSDLDRVRRRRLGKSAWWTLTGHLRGQHDVRGQAPFFRKTREEVEAWHDRLHNEAQA